MKRYLIVGVFKDCKLVQQILPLIELPTKKEAADALIGVASAFITHMDSKVLPPEGSYLAYDFIDR